MLWLLSCAEPEPEPEPQKPEPPEALEIGTLPIDATPPPVPRTTERSFQVVGEGMTLSYGPPLAGVLSTPDGPRLLLASQRDWWLFDVSDRQDVIFDTSSIWWSGADSDLGAIAGDVDGDGSDDLWAGARLRSGGAPEVELASVDMPELEGLTVVGDRVYTWDLDHVYVWDPPSATPTTTLTGSVRSIHAVGEDEVVAAAPWAEGRGWLLSDLPAGQAAIEDVATATLHLEGFQAAVGADLDGDGARELIVAGCADWMPVPPKQGRVAYVIDPDVGDIDVRAASWARLIASEPFCHPALAVGDFDADGQDDLALGGSTFLKGYEGHDLGMVWVIDGPVARDATIDMVAEGRLHVVGPYTEFGRRLVAGDLDDDGEDELLVSGSLGSPWVSGSQPSVWVLQRP